MNETEHLLSCLAEEAGEIVQAVGKAQRFGLNDTCPDKEDAQTNACNIAAEIAHLKAIANMLDLRAYKREDILIDEKIARVYKWMDYARARGTLR